MTHIPYRGAAASVTDLMGGHVDLAFVSLSSALPQLRAQRLRAIAITSPKRSALMPELPTFVESGLPGFVVTGWFGLVAPNGTPKVVIDRVHDSVADALAHPDVLQTLTTYGLEPAGANTPDQFGQFLETEIEKWAQVVRVSGARAD